MLCEFSDWAGGVDWTSDSMLPAVSQVLTLKASKTAWSSGALHFGTGSHPEKEKMPNGASQIARGPRPYGR
eukprot:5746896-Amphidinium_carterae.1